MVSAPRTCVYLCVYDVGGVKMNVVAIRLFVS